MREDHTIVLAKVDPLQDAPGIEDNVIVDLDDIASGSAILVVRSGEGEGEHFALTKDLTTIGRHADSDIELDDITVSRRHSEIHRQQGTSIVKDAGSLNGTYLNGERIDVAELSHGDELQIGKFHLVYLESVDSLA